MIPVLNLVHFPAGVQVDINLINDSLWRIVSAYLQADWMEKMESHSCVVQR